MDKTKNWSLSNIPPIGDPDVADFAYLLFTIAKNEKERLNKPNDFLSNYALYRGDDRRQLGARKGQLQRQSVGKMPVNLYFSNIERTISNIAAQNPTGEVIDMDGIKDEGEDVMSTALGVWWDNTNQWDLTLDTARQMELYGITVEHPTVNVESNLSHFKMPNIDLIDPFAIFPAPGKWNNLSTDCPYICLIGWDYVASIEKKFGVSDVASESAYELLGMQREDFKPLTFGSLNRTIGNYRDPMTLTRIGDPTNYDKSIEGCIPIEVWIRDTRTKTEVTRSPILDESGNQIIEDGKGLFEEVKTEKLICRDGVRKITIVKSKRPSGKNRSGYIVLDDCVNPNLNPNLPDKIAEMTYPWGRLPFYHSNSYKDGISIWGFSASEQVGDLLIKINQIINKIIAYVLNVTAPPLIIQKNCGITREMVESNLQKSGRLVLMPTVKDARIEFMQIPNLPATFFQILEFIIKMFDRIYAIEDADRGKNPSGVRATSAIVALQERNQVVMKPKTAAVEHMVEERSKWVIGFWQNFGTTMGETVNVNETPVTLLGSNYAGRRFNYVVEAGSMMPKTKLQIQDLAKWLWQTKAIGQRGLLENIGWPDWKNEVKRTAESQLDQALQILIEAGLPEEGAVELKKLLFGTQENNQKVQ